MSDRPIRAPLRYTIDTGTKPVNETTGPGGRLRQRTGGKNDDRTMSIEDARPRVGELSLDREGFVLVPHATAVRDFWDRREREEVYDREIEQLVQDQTGAARVVVFDHTLRSTDPARQDSDYAREPVQLVHNDYTEWSGPQRLRDLLPDEAEALLQRRFAIVQVWRAIGAPIEAWPLALCDARTLESGDLIAAERRHPNRVGEVYQIAHSPAHRWCTFPRMSRDEALVFKVYDSRPDVARFVAHTSFELPGGHEGAAPRESLEVRTLALFT